MAAILGSSAGSSCRSASMVAITAPVDSRMPIASAAALPTLRRSRTARSCGSVADSSVSTRQVPSVLPSSMTSTSQFAP
jgi:hypothetical protein